MKPYDYQLNLTEDIKKSFQKGNKRVVMCLPTGGGKTVTFSYMISRVLGKNKLAKTLILTDRTELLYQANNTLNKFGIESQTIDSKTKYVNLKKNCYVAMVKTLVNRLKSNPNYLPPITLCIIDEAHVGDFKAIIPYLEALNIPTIGATATPIASSKKTPLNLIFQDIVTGPQISELIERGFLSPCKSFEFEKELKLKKRSGEFTNESLMLNYDCENQYLNVVEAYKSKSLNKKTLVFNCNIDHSRKMNEYFLASGFNSRNLDSKCSAEEREDTIAWFKSTPDAILNNCGILTKGFDEPSIISVILNRATMSLSLFLQMAGRGGRTFEGKEYFNLIDLGNNLIRHSLWEADRDWKFIFENAEIPEDGVTPSKTCKQCYALNSTTAKFCYDCKSPFPDPEKKEDFERMGLKEFKAKMPKELIKPLSEMSLAELIKRAEYGTGQKPYHKSWIFHQIKGRSEAYELLKEYQELKGYKQGWFIRKVKELKIYPNNNDK